MSQHLEDRVLTDLAFDLLDAKAAAAAKRHLQGCKACKARQRLLRATIGQLDATKKDIVASEDLIARTLRATRGETTSPAPAAQAATIRVQPKSHAPADNILDLPPRKDVLDMSRFFWIAAAAALVVAGIVTISTQMRSKQPATVALSTPAKESAAKDQLRTAPAADAAYFRADHDAVDKLAAPAERNEPAPSVPNSAATIATYSLKEAPATPPVEIAAIPEARADRRMPRDAAEAAPVKMERQQSGAEESAEKSKMLGGAIVAQTPSPAAAPVQIAAIEPKRARLMKSADEVPGAKSADDASGARGSVPAAKPAPMALSAAAAVQSETADVSFAFTSQTVSFVLPITSGTWVLQQNIRVRASVTDDDARLDISNHGALPVHFRLMPRRGTNVLRQFELDAGSATNFVHPVR